LNQITRLDIPELSIDPVQSLRLFPLRPAGVFNVHAKPQAEKSGKEKGERGTLPFPNQVILDFRSAP
jgi:hypothetical protein